MPGAITGTVGASTSPGLFSLVSVDAIVVLDAGTAADMHKWVDTLRNSLVRVHPGTFCVSFRAIAVDLCV